MDTVQNFEVDLIDLGAATVETRGGSPVIALDVPVDNFRDEASLAQD